MMTLNLQMFAKSASQAAAYRKSKAYAKGKTIEAEIKMAEKQKPVTEKKPTKGEAVTAVNRQEVYEIYRVEHGKEIPVVKDGNIVTRTGAEILQKMVFDKERGVWKNSQDRRYRVRKRR